ncbi:MAG: helix-turn-helix transcriptional regulator [Acidobacteriota bacterium]
MIGHRLREVRNAQQLSLTDVATEAKISVATLSRIETNKQGLDFEMFLNLARILHTAPNNFLESEGESQVEPIAERLTTLGASDRVKFWRELSAAKRARRVSESGHTNAGASQQLEELLAQIDYLREEIEAMRTSASRVPVRRSVHSID